MKVLILTSAFMFGHMEHPETWIMRITSAEQCATMQRINGRGPAGWIETKCFLIRSNGELQELPYYD